MSLLQSLNRLRNLLGQPDFTLKCAVPECSDTQEYDLPNGEFVCANHYTGFLDSQDRDEPAVPCGGCYKDHEGWACPNQP